jgi:peptide/nickel transport system permease protein
MIAYCIRRLVQAIPILWGVFTATFVLFFVVPGDPTRLFVGQRADVRVQDELRRQWHLDGSRWEQYGFYGVSALTLDFGRSFAYDRPVKQIILQRLPATAVLAISSLTVGATLGVLFGTLSAVRHHGTLDHAVRAATLLLVATPTFLLGMLLQCVFALKWPLFPVAGYLNGPRGIAHLVLPTICLAAGPFATLTRLVRASVLDVLELDYVRTARAKGVGESVVIVKHALRNALIPAITAITGSLAGLLAGALLVEVVFSWPGMGLLALDAINNRDLPMIIGIVFLNAVLFIGANILGDVGYALANPRVRLRGGSA